MKIVIDIDERDYKTIKRNADSFIYDNSAYDQLVSKVFHSIKDAKEEVNMLHKNLSEYQNILTETVNYLSDIKRGDFLYGKWLAYSDCLYMIHSIMNQYEMAGGGDDVAR